MSDISRFFTVRTELERDRKLLVRESETLLNRIEGASQQLDEKGAHAYLQHLLTVHRIRDTVDGLLQSLTMERGLPLYIASAWFLYDCYRHLIHNGPTKQGPESQIENMYFVTGSHIQNLFTMDRMVLFELEKQSAVYVKGKAASSHQVLIELDERHGHRLHGWFHSHPGTGANATHPSSIDKSHQARLERGGYPAIGAIFVRDGFVRFFSLDRDFEVQIYGKGAKRIDENLYRLTQISQVSNSADHAHG